MENKPLKVKNTSKKISWSSEKTATVISKGKVTAKSLGSTYVYGKQTEKYKCKVTVKDRIQSNKSSIKANDGKLLNDSYLGRR